MNNTDHNEDIPVADSTLADSPEESHEAMNNLVNANFPENLEGEEEALAEEELETDPETDPEAETDPDGEDPEIDPEDDPDGDDPDGKDDDKPADSLQWMNEHLEDFIEDGQTLETQEDYQKAVASLAESHQQTKADLQQEVELNEKVADLFHNSPEFTQVARNMSEKGMSFPEALARSIDLDSIAPSKEDDPEAHEQFMRQKWEREQQAKEQKKQLEDQQAERQANEELSRKTVKEFQESTGYDQKQMTTLLKRVDGTIKDLLSGKVTPELLTYLDKATNFDDAVTQARQEGEVEGKNQSVNKARKKKKGDGLPKPRKSGSNITPKTADPFMESLKGMAEDSDYL